MRVAAVMILAGCIEGPEPESIHNIVPRVCETGLGAMPEFTIDGDYELETQMKLETDPPRFELATGSGVIDLNTTIGEFGVVTLRPAQPLPPDADLELQVVDLGALDGVYVPSPLFPAPYSTREAPRIRSARAIDNHVFVSFSQPLDEASVIGAVRVRRGVAPVAATIDYIEAGPGHVVHVLVEGSGAIDVIFAPTLRTSAGNAVFATDEVLAIDPAYTVPEPGACEMSE